MKLPTVTQTFARIMAEGVDRHDAVHAVGSVLLEHMHDLLQGGTPTERTHSQYDQALEKMTAKGWLDEYSS